MAKIPKAVLKAEAEAEAAIAQMDQEIKETADSTVALEDIPLDLDDQTPAPETPEEPKAVETPEEKVVEDPAIEVEPAQPISEVDWRQKYKTLEGKYNAEVPRLQASLALVQSQLVTPPVAAPAAAPATPEGPAHTRYLKKDEVADYGDEILDMQARMARGVAQQEAQALLTPLLKRIDQLEAQTAQTAGESLWDKVERKIPNARQINSSDPLWHEFLSKVEPMSGLRYSQIGETAIASGDVARLVSLFTAYAKTQTSTVETPVLEEKESSPVKPRKTASEPVRTKEKAKPLIKESQVSKFYDDVVRGRYQGREKERDAREREIEQAVQEGRVVAG